MVIRLLGSLSPEFVVVCGRRLLAAVSDRSGERCGLLRRADPAPLSDLKWLQLTEAAKCEGGDWGAQAPDKNPDRF